MFGLSFQCKDRPKLSMLELTHPSFTACSIGDDHVLLAQENGIINLVKISPILTSVFKIQSENL